MSTTLLHTAFAKLLDSLSQPPQILALGEPTHGLEVFPQIRNRFFQWLVAERGFRSIALESDALSGLEVNEFVLGQSESLDAVMATGFSHGFGSYPANRELMQWIREWNQERPRALVRFYGFDAPMENFWAASPRLNLLGLQAFLKTHLGELRAETSFIEHLCGEDALWTNEAAALEASQSVGAGADAQQLRLLADELHALLRREQPGLGQLPGFWEAELHARTALGLLRYHANMALPDSERKVPDRLATMLSLRGLMMADNLHSIIERERRCGPVFVFAHNLHLQRQVSGLNMQVQRMQWWGAGAHISQQLGPEYAFIGSAMGQAESLGIGQPAQNTPEGRLMQLPETVNLLTRTELKAMRSEILSKRADFPPQAFPLKPALLEAIDGLVFVKDAGANLSE